MQSEIDQLDFEGPTPRAAELSGRWHRALDDARDLVRMLPPEHVGRCVLDHHGQLEKASPVSLAQELASGRVTFHEGCIKGAFPEIRA